jgi:DNA-binding response OmpR family regulator
VRTTHQAEPLKTAYNEFQPDIVVLDLGIPRTDGVELLNFLMEAGSSAQILIFRGLDHRMLKIAAYFATARGLSMAGVLVKAIRIAELRAKLRSLGADIPVNRSV